MNKKNAEVILTSKLAIFDAETKIIELEKQIKASRTEKEKAEYRYKVVGELIEKIGELPEAIQPFAFVDSDFSPEQPRILIHAPGLAEIRYLSHMSPSARWYYSYDVNGGGSGACCSNFEEAFEHARRVALEAVADVRL